MITAKLQSGYQRDLQRLKAPLFRSIDLAVDSVDIMAYLLDGMSFLPENIELDDGISSPRTACRFVTLTARWPNAIQSNGQPSIINRSPDWVEPHEIHLHHLSDVVPPWNPGRLWPEREDDESQ